MFKRAFVGFVLAAASALPLASFAQTGKVWKITYIAPVASSGPSAIQSIQAGMSELGHVAGRDYQIDFVAPEGQNNQYPAVVQDALKRGADILVPAGNSAIRAARDATQTKPIVFVSAGSPVEMGFIASNAKPGGNITGRSAITQKLDPQRVDLLREILPNLSRLAILVVKDATEDGPSRMLRPTIEAITKTAAAHGITTRPFVIAKSPEYEALLHEMKAWKADALIVFDQAVVFAVRPQLSELARKLRLPTAFQSSSFVEAGGLFSYSQNQMDEYRLLAQHIDKIMKGANPGDLPVEEPKRIELTINQKTARDIGVTVPQSMLKRAARVID